MILCAMIRAINIYRVSLSLKFYVGLVCRDALFFPTPTILKSTVYIEHVTLFINIRNIMEAIFVIDRAPLPEFIHSFQCASRG